MTEVLIGILACVAAVVWAEAREWLPWLAKRIVIKAVEALPIELRPRMQEELLAEISEVPGKISPMLFAASLWWGYWRAMLASRLDARVSHAATRVADILLASTLFTFVSPLIFLLMLVTRAEAEHSAFARVRRFGKNGRPIYIYCFSKSSRKPLGTAYYLGLEWLPSYLNVIYGELSLVGPPAQKVPADYKHPHLKAGLVWNESLETELIEQYGKSTLGTLRVYFRVLWRESGFFFAGRHTRR